MAMKAKERLIYQNFQEQQGYLVDCLIRRANGAQGIKFVVESTKHPEYIEQRISNFLKMMTVSSEKFEINFKPPEWFACREKSRICLQRDLKRSRKP